MGTFCEKLFKYKFEVYGLLSAVEFQKARVCVEELRSKHPYKLCEPVVVGMLECDWMEFMTKKKREVGGDLWINNGPVFVFMDGKYFGNAMDLINLAKHRYDYKDPKIEIIRAMAKEEHDNCLIDTLHMYCFLDIVIDGNYIGRLTFELHNDILPRTCQNFLALCLGYREFSGDRVRLWYRDTIFHRLKKEVWIQGGDLKRGEGQHITSAFGSEFPDENFGLRHDRRGIISMANRGKHTNGDQFIISLQENPWMDRTYVAFGHLVEGYHVLKGMEEVETDLEKPLKEIKIVNCGEIYMFPCICHDTN